MRRPAYMFAWMDIPKGGAEDFVGIYTDQYAAFGAIDERRDINHAQIVGSYSDGSLVLVETFHREGETWYQDSGTLGHDMIDAGLMPWPSDMDEDWYHPPEQATDGPSWIESQIKPGHAPHPEPIDWDEERERLWEWLQKTFARPSFPPEPFYTGESKNV